MHQRRHQTIDHARLTDQGDHLHPRLPERDSSDADLHLKRAEAMAL